MQHRHSFRIWTFLALFAVVVLAAACGGGAQSTAREAAPAQPSAPTQAVAPTAVPAAAKPTEALKPTAAPPTQAPAPTAPPVPTDTPQPAPTEAPKAEAPTGQAGIDLLISAMRAQLAQKAYRMNMTSEDAGTTTHMTIEYVAPDSFHSKTDRSETIILKGASYIKEAGGKWQKSPIDMSGMISQVLNPKMVEELTKDMTVDKFKFVGPDLIGGKPMWVYQYETTMDLTGTKINTAAKVWLGALDKLPYKQEGESDSVLHPGGKTKTSSTWEYDPNLKIEAPIP